MKLSDLAELCYRLRGRGKKDSISRDDLREIEEWAVSCLRDRGFDPGRTADSADGLKLRLIRGEDAEVVGETKGDDVASRLYEVVRLDGCDITPYKAVGRWADFVNRVVLAPKLMDDDPVLPVAAWIQRRPVDTGDFADLARAFAEWTEEANAAFAKSGHG